MCTVTEVPRQRKKEDPVTRFALNMALERKNWDQTEFAEKLGIGKQAVTNWLNRGMSAKYHIKVAGLLHCTVEELVRAGKPGEGPRESTKEIFGVELSAEAAHFAAEWMKLRSPLKAQFQAFIQTLVHEQAHDARKPSVDVSESLHRSQSS